MSSQHDIAQQFLNGGVIPADLVGQDSVSKTYVDTKVTIQNGEISNVASLAVAAQNTADIAQTRIDNIVANVGESNTEIVDARQPNEGPAFPVLGARLNNIDDKLAEISYNVNNFTGTDTQKLQAAIDLANSVGGGTVNVPKNLTLTIDMVYLKSNVTITGGGTLKYKSSTTSFALLILDHISNVVIDNITFDGNFDNQSGFNESRHAVIFYGSTDVTIRNCHFKNLIGDGIYLSQSGDLVHNANVMIHNNRFIGDNTNRNGISIIHCKDTTITENYFKGMARDDMPGDIDVEPNITTESVTGLIIARNTMIGTGTPSLQKAVAINNAVGGTCTDISIIDNKINGNYKYAIAVFGDTANHNRTHATVKGNTIQSTVSLVQSAAIILSSYGEHDVAENTINSTCEIGVKSVGCVFKINNNKIKNCTQYGIQSLSAFDRGMISGNKIDDCGTNAASSFGGIHINGGRDLLITNNEVVSSVSTKSQTGLYIQAGVKNFINGNVFRGMGARAMNVSVAPQVFGHNIGSTSFNSINGTYPPTSESWVEGDTIYLPTTDGYVYKCTVRGTPGTWVTTQNGYLTSISSTPVFIGQMALVAGVWYKAKGTASTSDWVALN